MIGSGSIVPHGFGREVAHKYRAGIGDLGGQRLRIVSGQNKVLGRIRIGESQHGSYVGQKNSPAVLKRQGRYVAARQRGELARSFGLHLFEQGSRRTEYDDLRIGAVLGLRKQIGRDENGIGRFIGNNEYFGRARGHVDGHAKLRRGQLLGGRDVAVAGTEYFIDRRHRGRAQREGRDGLGPTGFHHRRNPE